MCGVAGLFHPTREAPPGVAELRRMADAIAHRGPDGEGFHAEPHIGFGHRRLSFVDLAGGAQPMATPDGAVVVCFNGEIYNHAALRAELEAAGHLYQTRSDTETLLHGWREWGTGLLGRLSGMFAFALWDRNRGELLLARDRAGEKPMHWSVLPDGTLAFASEIPALLALPGVSRAMDPAAAEDFLALGYIPDPATIHRAIRRLPAAHFLLLRRGQAELDLAPRRYWQPPRAANPHAAEGAARELERRLDAAVRAQLMSDVPLGAFLSGGVDSASVTALAARALREAGAPALSTFTIGFDNANDERGAARALAARLGTEHRDALGTADYLAAAREMAGVFAEPFGDHSCVPTLAVCRLARRHVKGALSGDGGDEVFAGYRRYRFHALVEGARRLLPADVRRRAVGALARLYPKLDRAPRFLRAKTTLTELSLDSAMGYYRTVSKIQDERRRALWSPAQRAAIDGHDPAARFAALMGECEEGADPLLQAQYADLHTYLPGDILVKTDRTSMAVSLELRPPILDPEVMGWGMALPPGLKLAGGVGKRVLREAMEPHLPAELLWGKKRGFADDLAGQFRARAGEVRARLGGGAMEASGLFDRAALLRLADEHESGAFDHAQAIWQLLAFEGWLHAGAGGGGTATAGAAGPAGQERVAA